MLYFKLTIFTSVSKGIFLTYVMYLKLNNPNRISSKAQIETFHVLITPLHWKVDGLT